MFRPTRQGPTGQVTRLPSRAAAPSCRVGRAVRGWPGLCHSADVPGVRAAKGCAWSRTAKSNACA
eukprot:15466188-Alexandrium_andersonii.AAC.1